jgi:hypothetical protein
MLDLGSDEADRPRQNKPNAGKPQLLEPPGADPHAGWCGRGAVNDRPPIPIHMGVWHNLAGRCLSQGKGWYVA